MNRRDLIKAFAAAVPLTVAGRVWAAPATDARLLVVFLRGAYDAANVAHELYNSTQNPTRDRAGKALRFTIPTVANGRVYVPTKREIDVYGLLQPARQPTK